MIKQLKKRKFKGALVDTYVAGELEELQSDELRINKIIDYDSHYGVVFGGGVLSQSPFRQCFEDYVLTEKAGIYKKVEDNTNPMKVNFLIPVILCVFFSFLSTAINSLDQLG